MMPNRPIKTLEDRVTHVLSECLNDNAPLGEEKYRWVAKAVLKELSVAQPQVEPTDAVQAWEQYLAVQKWVPYMPGLKPRPAFIAGWNTKTQPQAEPSALQKAADTFADLARGLRLLRHPVLAEACEIAERETRAAIAAPVARPNGE
jgi:hypothetical protein